MYIYVYVRCDLVKIDSLVMRGCRSRFALCSGQDLLKISFSGLKINVRGSLHMFFNILVGVYWSCLIAVARSGRPSSLSDSSRLLHERHSPPLISPRAPIPSTEKESMRSSSRSNLEFLRSSADIMTYVTGRKKPKSDLEPKIVGGQAASDSEVRTLGGSWRFLG